MTRKERVLRILKTLSAGISLEDIEEGLSIGFDAETISDATNIDRSNVSRELNNLVREGRAFKIVGRPVRFLDKGSLEEIMPINYDGNYIFNNVDDFYK